MKAREEGCRLCDALQHAQGRDRPCDTVLLETAGFVLLPAIGPLARGHALITSKEHWPSLASMPLQAIREYDNLAHVLATVRAISGDVLEAEHGSTSDCTAGACVAHTHINLIPGAGRHADIFNDKLPVLGNFGAVRTVRTTVTTNTPTKHACTGS